MKDKKKRRMTTGPEVSRPKGASGPKFRSSRLLAGVGRRKRTDVVRAEGKEIRKKKEEESSCLLTTQGHGVQLKRKNRIKTRERGSTWWAGGSLGRGPGVQVIRTIKRRPRKKRKRFGHTREG